MKRQKQSSEREVIMIDLELGNWKDFIETMLRK